MFDKYMQEHLRTTPINVYYPLFSRVQVQPDGKRDTNAELAYISSVDDKGKFPYGVCYLNNSLYPQDIKKSRVHFSEDNVLAAISNSASPGKSRFVEPKTYKQAMTLPDAAEWKVSTYEEVDSLASFKVLKSVKKEDIPEDSNILGSRFVYKYKLKNDSTLDKRKTRMVAQGFTQSYGEDYDETFAPVSQLLSVRIVLAMAIQYGLLSHHIDVKCAFLNSELDYDIYMRLPEGFLTLHGLAVCQVAEELIRTQASRTRLASASAQVSYGFRQENEAITGGTLSLLHHRERPHRTHLSTRG